jgi:nitroreductase
MDDLRPLETLVGRRRTNLRMDADRPVPLELVERLCRLATWAPNHKRTWPWRFAALVGDARARLGAAVADFDAGRGAPAEKVAKARVKYLRAPLMLAVASAGDGDPVRRRENRDAVAAGVQNILLGATAAGLASYWGTGAVVEAPAVRALCGFAPEDDLVALLYLGWPIGEVPVPDRPPPWLHVVD